MGELLFKFVEWWSKPREIDLTQELEGEPGGTFEPPVNTTLSRPAEEIPSLLDIIASDVRYTV